MLVSHPLQYGHKCHPRYVCCLWSPPDFLRTYTTLSYRRDDAGRVRTDKSRLGLGLEYGMDLDVYMSVFHD